MLCTSSPSPDVLTNFDDDESFKHPKLVFQLRYFYQALLHCEETDEKVELLDKYKDLLFEEGVDCMMVPILSMFRFEGCKNKALEKLADIVVDFAYVISVVTLLYQNSSKRTEAVAILLNAM
jgi:hypothetical protein